MRELTEQEIFDDGTECLVDKKMDNWIAFADWIFTNLGLDEEEQIVTVEEIVSKHKLRECLN